MNKSDMIRTVIKKKSRIDTSHTSHISPPATGRGKNYKKTN